jgi:hypothetical protein
VVQPVVSKDMIVEKSCQQNYLERWTVVLLHRSTIHTSSLLLKLTAASSHSNQSLGRHAQVETLHVTLGSSRVSLATDCTEFRNDVKSNDRETCFAVDGTVLTSHFIQRRWLTYASVFTTSVASCKETDWQCWGFETALGHSTEFSRVLNCEKFKKENNGM